ncbi:hypothetical protein ABKN59_011753 [Abortiporus biennis]
MKTRSLLPPMFLPIYDGILLRDPLMVLPVHTIVHLFERTYTCDIKLSLWLWLVCLLCSPLLFSNQEKSFRVVFSTWKLKEKKDKTDVFVPLENSYIC